MANAYRGEATLAVGGDTYRLRLGTNEYALLEHAFNVRGMDPEQSKLVVISIALNGSNASVRAFLHACIQRSHPSMTMDQVGDLLDDPEVMARANALIPEMIESAFPPLKGKLLPTPSLSPAAPEPHSPATTTEPAAT